jgi:ABC-2 type transport system permease protein
MNGRWTRIKAVVRRHFIVLWRSPARWFDIAIWPLFDVVLFGSLGAFVAQENGTSRAAVPYLLAGIMLFHVLFQSQIGISTGFMEETWNRNVLNLFTSPLSEAEYAAGLALYTLIKSALAITTISLVAFGFYRFGLGEVGWTLVPVVAVLLVLGFAIAMVSIGLMLRFGPSAEIFTYGMNFLALAISGVFNPVSALPGVIQPVARVLPTTYAFGAARHVLDGGGVPWADLGRAMIGGVVAVALAFLFVTRMLVTFKRRGFVTRYS